MRLRQQENNFYLLQILHLPQKQRISIIPSLPIFVSYVILTPAFGKFFTWVRLSVTGNPEYETSRVWAKSPGGFH